MGSLGAVLLAAGASTRMGRVKQLLPWKESTLLEHSIEQLKKSNIDSLVVVLGANEDLIRDQVDLGNFDVVVNTNWEQGMASSIACGVSYLKENTFDLEGVLIALSDQPLLDSKYYRKLIDKSLDKDSKIVCSAYSDRVGVPAVFDPMYIPNLLQLKGQRGARALLRGGRVEVSSIDAGDRAVDLDTIEEYNRIYDLYGRI